MKIRNFICSIVVVAVTFFGAYAHAADFSKNIFVSNAWVQAMPPSQKITAAYMTIANNSSQEAVLTSASCAIAGAAEIHQMSDMNGMMHMAMASEIRIPALGKVVLSPNGFHLMLIDLKKPVNKGDMVLITLHFQDGNTIMVNAEAQPSRDDAPATLAKMNM